MNIRFETDRLVVRDIEKEDMDSLLKIYSEKKNMKYLHPGNKYKHLIKKTAQKVGQSALLRRGQIN